MDSGGERDEASSSESSKISSSSESSDSKSESSDSKSKDRKSKDESRNSSDKSAEDDDEHDEHDNESSTADGDDGADERFQRIYQQLGAPTVVVRHQKTYDPAFDLPPQLAKKYKRSQAAYVHGSLQLRNRAKLRWFNTDAGAAREDGQVKIDNVIAKARDRKKKKTAKTCNTKATLKSLNEQHDLIDDEKYLASNVPPSVQADRAKLLKETHQNQDLDPDNEVPDTEDSAGALLREVSQFDHPYILGKYERPTRQGIRARLPTDRLEKSRIYAKVREFASDPAYLAPFGVDIIAKSLPKKKKRGTLASLPDLIPSPTQYGNCLLCLPCPCRPCNTMDPLRRSWVLFHPTGDLLDQMCVSNVILPCDQGNGTYMLKKGEWKLEKDLATKRQKARQLHPNTIDIGDTILGITQCGNWDSGTTTGIFLVHTPSHVTVVKVTPKPSCEPVGGKTESGHALCWGNYHVEVHTFVNHRSLSRNETSYWPVAVASHPRHGNSEMMMPGKFAIANRSNRNTFNVVHHVNVYESKCEISTHQINNLKQITHIDFMQAHPMCLWSAAKSFVNPTYTVAVGTKSSQFGIGTSLFSIDLRTNISKFEWSPSADDCLTEGVHSISSVATDWRNNYSVWVSSISAGKTWEIDGRMPCRALNTWMLPMGCDEFGGILPPTGVFGEGCLLHHPTPCFDLVDDSLDSIPVFCVNKTLGSFGFHVYQRPEERLPFQIKPVECPATPGLRFSSTSKFVTSSVFALPDVSNNVFTYGLTTLRAPISRFLSVEYSKGIVADGEPEPNILCALTMTNTGTVYSHMLLESDDTAFKAKRSTHLSVGTQAFGVPQPVTENQRPAVIKLSGGMNLNLGFKNEAPPRSAARMPPPRMIYGDRSVNLKSAKPIIRKKAKQENPENPEAWDMRRKIQQSAFPSLQDNIRSGTLFTTDTETRKKTPAPNVKDKIVKFTNEAEEFIPVKKAAKRSAGRKTIERTDLTQEMVAIAGGLWEKLEKGDESEEDSTDSSEGDSTDSSDEDDTSESDESDDSSGGAPVAKTKKRVAKLKKEEDDTSGSDESDDSSGETPVAKTKKRVAKLKKEEDDTSESDESEESSGGAPVSKTKKKVSKLKKGDSDSDSDSNAGYGKRNSGKDKKRPSKKLKKEDSDSMEDKESQKRGKGGATKNKTKERSSNKVDDNPFNSIKEI